MSMEALHYALVGIIIVQLAIILLLVKKLRKERRTFMQFMKKIDL